MSVMRRTESANVAAVILLAGGIRPSPLVRDARRSALDLSLTPERTALDFWLDALEGVASERPAEWALPIRIIHDAKTPAPRVEDAVTAASITTEVDSGEYRGPAGVARDACEGYEDDALVVIADAARVVRVDVAEVVRRHEASGAAATVVCDADDAPAGLYVARCGSLTKLAPATGFMDLKEQWLGRVRGAGLPAGVHRVAPGRTWPLRTREDVLAAAQWLSGGARWPRFSDAVVTARECDPEAKHFRVIAAGAHVEPGAIVVDSVVMPGAFIGSGAVVARSLVCPGTEVDRDAEVVDAVVSSRQTDRGDAPSAGRVRRGAA